MEHSLESNNNFQSITKMVKKLKIKETQLKQYSMKLAEEYIKTYEKISNMQVEVEICHEIEEECIDGLYKQHITLLSESKMATFYNEYSYENLIDIYQKKLDEYREENLGIIEVHTKKEMIYTEKMRILDMLSRQFASSDFSKIKLIDIANFNKREIEKLYKNTKEIIENEILSVMPEEREIVKDNHLGKVQFAMTNYWYEKEHIVQQDNTKKSKNKLWEWIKHFFQAKKPKMLEEGLEEKREKKLIELEEILKNTYYEVEYAGCFKSGKMEDKVHIMRIDEANIQENESVSERREMLKEEILIKV